MHLLGDEFGFEIFILCFSFLLILFVRMSNDSLTTSCDHVCLFPVQQRSEQANVRFMLIFFGTDRHLPPAGREDYLHTHSDISDNQPVVLTLAKARRINDKHPECPEEPRGAGECWRGKKKPCVCLFC